MAKLKAILFDLDGTLIDSEFFHFECWNEILIESDVQLTYEEWLKEYAGIPLDVNAKNIIKKYGIITPLLEIIERRQSLTLKRFEKVEIPLMHYVIEMLDYLKNRDLLLALVTGSPRQDVEAIFAKNGLDKYFEVMVTGTDVVKNKPNPECYELCLNQLGVKKEECLVFEDTVNGIKSAKAAGLMCFAIQKHKQEHEKLMLADQVFLNFELAEHYIIANHIL